jgi:toxin ParE1/3/4
MAQVARRPLAAADILEIWDYIAEDSLDEADLWVDRLDEKLGLLATQPSMGRARNELAAGLRSFPFGRYVIFYVPLADGIDVVRVLHSSRDVDLALGDDAA